MYDVWLNEVKKRWLMNDAAIFFFLFSTNYLLDVGEAFKLFLIKVRKRIEVLITNKQMTFALSKEDVLHVG